jgi:hypothetical protein
MATQFMKLARLPPRVRLSSLTCARFAAETLCSDLKRCQVIIQIMTSSRDVSCSAFAITKGARNSCSRYRSTLQLKNELPTTWPGDLIELARFANESKALFCSLCSFASATLCLEATHCQDLLVQVARRSRRCLVVRSVHFGLMS